MGKLSLALFLLLQPSLLLAASAPDAAAFPLTAHVVYSRALPGSGQRIDVLIDGKPMEFTGTAQGLLALGDYPARISPKIHAPRSWSSYDHYDGYDLLMPDAKTRTFYVTAVGTPLVPASSTAP